MSLIETKNLTKTFRSGANQLTVLHGINLKIEVGEFIAILGQSGSGKSTLMHILGCLDLPTTGVYLFENQDVSHMTSDMLAQIRNKKIGFVFQQFNLLHDLTALDNVALPLLYGNATEEQALTKAREVLTLVGLQDRMHHYPMQLSGGQQQRVSIARALVNSPAIIMADEPTGNLDSKTGMDMMSIFIELNTNYQITVIIVTHDENLAKRTNRIVRLLDGKIVEDTSSK